LPGVFRESRIGAPRGQTICDPVGLEPPKLRKIAHAGRGQETKWEIPKNCHFSSNKTAAQVSYRVNPVFLNANLWSRRNITKKARAVRGHEPNGKFQLE
jgi:hypothetical protein